MASKDHHILTIRTRGGDCKVVFEGDSLLAGSHSNVRKLFRKLVEFAGVPLDYDYLERVVYETESRGSQGNYNTKNAVRSLRTALFPSEEPDGQQKWKSEIQCNGITLLRLEKPHASRICLVLPRPPDDPDVYVDAELPGDHDEASKLRAAPPFTVPMAHCPHFIGREGILMDLHDKLSSDATSSVAICGAGGLGKTQIAVEYALINRDSYPGGIFWLDAKDTESLMEEYSLLSREVDAFQTPQDLPIEERARRVRERFHQLREPSLLILDSLVPKGGLLELLPATGCCRILATSRHPVLLKSRFLIVNLPELDLHTALLMLQSSCSIEQTADRLAAREPHSPYDAALRREKAALEGICDDLNERLPLTLTLIAAYVDQRKTTFEDCRKRLEADSLKVFERAEVTYSIQDAFNISSSGLSTPALRVLATASCFARKNISPKLLQAASMIDDLEAFEDAVAELARSSFINADRTGRLTIHDLLRDMTLAQINPNERNLLLDRAAESLTGSLSHSNESMAWDGVRWELVQSRAVAESCRLHRRHCALSELLFELGNYYRLQDQTSAAVAHFDEAVRIVAAFIPESARLLAKCKMQISATDPYSRAAITNARLALDIARADGGFSKAELSEFYNTFGYTLKMNEHPWRALPFYCKALELCEADLGRRSQKGAEYLNNISASYEIRGGYSSAIRYITEANSIFIELFGFDHPLVAFSLNTLGRIQRQLGDADAALISHETAKQIFLKLTGSETKNYAMSLYFESLAHAELANTDAAQTCANTALDILERKYGPEDPAARRVRVTIESRIFK